MFDSKKLGNLHGPVLFEIFKFLHSKHLLSSIVLVCSEWRQIVIECVVRLEIKEYNFKTWLQEELDPFKTDPKASFPSPHLQGYFHVERFIQSCATTFQNLNDLTLAGHSDLFSLELFIYMTRELKELNKLVLSDLCLHKGRYTRRMKKMPRTLLTSSSNNTSSRGFFSLFKKKAPVDDQPQPSSENSKSMMRKGDSDVLIEFVRADIDDLPLKISRSSSSSSSNLKQLYLYKVNLGTEDFNSMVDHLVVLKELRIVNCNVGSNKFELKPKSKQLSHIELNFANSNSPSIEIGGKFLHESLTHFVLNNVDCSTLPNFLESCKNLHYVSSRKYHHWELKNDLTIEHLTLDSENGPYIGTILKHTPNLKSFEFLNSVVEDASVEIIINVLNLKPNLTRLVLRNVKNLAGTSLLQSQHLLHLELSSLDLAEDCKIECPSLNTLILNSTTSLLDSSKSNAIMKSTHIRELGLSMLNSSEGISAAYALNNLVKLDFSYNRKLTSERLREILSFCPKLEFLNLKMTGIGGGFLPSESKLNTLLLSGSSISNTELNQLVKSCLELNRLDIDCCGDLTSIDLSCLHKLKSLDLSETTMKLNKIMECIDSVPSLRCLYLRWITHEGAWDETGMMKKCRNLLFLDVTGSYLSKPRFLVDITKNYKDLVVVPKTQIFRYETAIDPFVNYNC